MPDSQAQGTIFCSYTLMGVTPNVVPAAGLHTFRFQFQPFDPDVVYYQHSFKFLPEELDSPIHQYYTSTDYIDHSQVVYPTTTKVAYQVVVYDGNWNYICSSRTHLLPLTVGDWTSKVYLPLIIK
jgi:hypothetical protein